MCAEEWLTRESEGERERMTTSGPVNLTNGLMKEMVKTFFFFIEIDVLCPHSFLPVTSCSPDSDPLAASLSLFLSWLTVFIFLSRFPHAIFSDVLPPPTSISPPHGLLHYYRDSLSWWWWWWCCFVCRCVRHSFSQPRTDPVILFPSRVKEEENLYFSSFSGQP